MTILILNTKTATAIAKTFKTATVNTEKVLAAVKSFIDVLGSLRKIR